MPVQLERDTKQSPGELGTVIIQAATQADLAGITDLLALVDLPTAGLESQFPAAYAVLRRGAAIIAVAGVERYGEVGLLRSVAVHPELRSRGLARQLVCERLQRAGHDGMDRVYLLTTSAARFFQGLGFVEARRDQVPAELSASPEFAYACPASAVCLVRSVEPKFAS